MGLDQFGGLVRRKQYHKQEHAEFYWRKYHYLQEVICDIYYKKFGKDLYKDFEDEDILLEEEDIKQIEDWLFHEPDYNITMTNTNPVTDKQRALAFCWMARYWLSQGKNVYYYSSW